MINKNILSVILCVAIVAPATMQGAAAPFIDHSNLPNDGGQQTPNQRQKARAALEGRVTTQLQDANNAGEVASAQMLAIAAANRKAKILMRGSLSDRRDDLVRSAQDNQVLNALEGDILTAEAIEENKRLLQQMQEVDPSRRKLQAQKILQTESDAKRNRFGRYYSNTERTLQNAFAAVGQAPAVSLPLVVGTAIVNRDFKPFAIWATGSGALWIANKAKQPISKKLTSLYYKFKIGKLTPKEREEANAYAQAQMRLAAHEQALKKQQAEAVLQKTLNDSAMGTLQLLKEDRQLLKEILEENDPAEETDPQMKKLKERICQDAQERLLVNTIMITQSPKNQIPKLQQKKLAAKPDAHKDQVLNTKPEPAPTKVSTAPKVELD